MGVLTEKVKAGGENLAASWGDRLLTWLVRFISNGLIKFLEVLEPEAIDLTRDQLAKIRDDPLATPEQKVLIDKLLEGTRPIPVVILVIMGIAMLIPTITSIFQPLGDLWAQKQQNVVKTYRLDPAIVINLWRRFGDKYPWIWGDMSDQGITDFRIDALKDATLFYPTPSDLVRWQAREVFEPEMVQKYGLDSELGGIEREAFYKAGMDDEQIRNFWRAHWEHPSWQQIVEMLHRDLITEEDVYDWFRLIEVPPYWRDLLIKTAYTWPTRVDTRRFYALGTIDDTRLREVYMGMGYRGQALEDNILWTKVYTKFPRIKKKWEAGTITKDEIKSILLGWGMTSEGADELITNEIEEVEPEGTAEGKAFTKTEIYNGVKEGIITREEGIDLLTQLGYTLEQAEYLIEIKT